MTVRRVIDGLCDGAAAGCTGRCPSLLPSHPTAAPAFSSSAVHLDPRAHAASALRPRFLPHSVMNDDHEHSAWKLAESQGYFSDPPS